MYWKGGFIEHVDNLETSGWPHCNLSRCQYMAHRSLSRRRSCLTPECNFWLPRCRIWIPRRKNCRKSFASSTSTFSTTNNISQHCQLEGWAYRFGILTPPNNPCLPYRRSNPSRWVHWTFLTMCTSRLRSRNEMSHGSEYHFWYRKKA